MSEYFYGAARKAAPKRNNTMIPQPPVWRGTSASGTIVKLFVGQGHGYIRLADDREIFFHRSDVCEGTSFNAFTVGDAVAFDLLEDSVSGPRALRVKQRRRRR